MTGVAFTNLPGTIVNIQDGNLVPEAPVTGPRVAILGTAGKGSANPYYVSNTATAKGQYGKEGTLIRGMYEAIAAGAQDMLLVRIGATAAKVTGIGNNGGTGGYTVETMDKDGDAGQDWEMYYDDSENRIVVRRVSDQLIVYDNSTTAPINRYMVNVSGYRASVGGPDIGSPSSFVALQDIDSSTYAGTTYTAGDDGLNLSRMEMYEVLYDAYEELKMYDFDVIVPMEVYLDDYNVKAQGSYIGAVTPEAPSANTYPTAGSFAPGTSVDSLGKVYVEEYLGKNYFWWVFSDGTFTAADIYPTSVGSASATKKIDGTNLSADDFHEVNFAYQLGRFLYEYSTNIVDATGVIGVLPPTSTSLTDRALWWGKAPTWTYNTSEDTYYISSPANNGYGLLGNKFMVGRDDHRNGVYGGGFIATETKFLDGGDEVLDDNDIPIDLGKFFSVVIDYPLMRNNYSSTSYCSNWAASYAGFYVNRVPSSAPTNKRVSGATIVYKKGVQTIDDLAGCGYVSLREKTTGLVVADAPTASMPGSDWTRLSTVRIAKVLIDGARLAIDPYLGEGGNSASKANMKSAVEQVLLAAKKLGYIQSYQKFEIIQTPSMEATGRAKINLVFVPAFELRQVELSISVSKSS